MVKIQGPAWYTIYHLAVVKGVNKPLYSSTIGKGHLPSGFINESFVDFPKIATFQKTPEAMGFHQIPQKSHETTIKPPLNHH